MRNPFYYANFRSDSRNPPNRLLFYIRYRHGVKRPNGLSVQIDISEGCDERPNVLRVSRAAVEIQTSFGPNPAFKIAPILGPRSGVGCTRGLGASAIWVKGQGGAIE